MIRTRGQSILCQCLSSLHCTFPPFSAPPSSPPLLSQSQELKSSTSFHGNSDIQGEKPSLLQLPAKSSWLLQLADKAKLFPKSGVNEICFHGCSFLLLKALTENSHCDAAGARRSWKGCGAGRVRIPMWNKQQWSPASAHSHLSPCSLSFSFSLSLCKSIPAAGCVLCESSVEVEFVPFSAVGTRLPPLCLAWHDPAHL